MSDTGSQTGGEPEPAPHTESAKVADLVARLRDYDLCHDGDVDEAADCIVRLAAQIDKMQSAFFK